MLKQFALSAKLCGFRIREGRKKILSAYIKVILFNITLRNRSGTQKLLKELFEGYILEWVLAAVVASFMIWLTVRIVGHFRENEDRHVDTTELLIQFSEMRREGDLTDDEFRFIKKRLVNPTENSLEKEETTDQTE